MSKSTKSPARSKAIKQSSVWSRKGTAGKNKLAVKVKTQMAASQSKRSSQTKKV